MKYDHNYASHQVAAPVITHAEMATEDCAGDLTTTHTLMSSLLGDIEGMQQIARQSKERPGSIDPQAVNARLDALWALAETIDARLKNSIILLNAIINKNNEADIADRRAA